MLKKTVSKLLSLFNLSVIKTEKLTKIDVERKNYRHENDMFKFIFNNKRIKSPQKLYSYLKFSKIIIYYPFVLPLIFSRL